MPLFGHNKPPAPAAPDPVDAVGLSQALLVELRGQRQDFKQSYALLESRLAKLEKALHRQPREAAAPAAPAARSPSDEEMRYVLGDAESMEIIVNLGPLRTGRPLSVERRALTPASRKWWDRDQDEDREDLDGERMPPAPGQQRPSRVIVEDSRHASFHAGKFAAQPVKSTAGGGAQGPEAGCPGARVPSSYHWVIGRNGALRDQRPPSPTPPPPPPPSPPPPPPPPPPPQPQPKRGQQLPRPLPTPPTIVTVAPAPASGVLRNKVESPAQAQLKPREEQGVSCVVLLAPDDQRGQVAGSPGPASSVCFSLEEDDDDKKMPRVDAGTVPRRGILGRPLSKTPNGAQGKDEAAKGGIADDKGVKTGEQVNKKTVQNGRHGERKDEKVGPGFSGSSLMTLHRSAPADYSSSKINTLVVPGLVRPSSSVCFSLEEYEKEQAEEEQEALLRRRGLVPAKANKPARPPGQYRPHALHGPYGPHRPYGAKRSTSAARLAWWRRSPPPSAPPPGRSSRPEAPGPAGSTGAVDEEGLRGCLRCVEYRASPRAAHRAAAGPRLPVRLRIGSSRQSRLGVQLRAYDGGQPHRHRSPHRRALQDGAEDSASRPASRVGSSVSPRVQSRASVYVGAVKSNIHLAKIYAKTDLVTAAARHSARPPPERGAPHRPLQHLPTCPRYDGPDPGDAKQLLTLFESRAAGQANRRAAAQTARDHRDYLAHLSEYVRAISKGPRPATVIRNQLRVVRDASPGAAKQQPSSQRTFRGAATRRDRYYRPPEPAGREQLRWREPLAIMDVQETEPLSPPHSAARHKREPTHSAHRKHTCRDSRSQRPRGRRRAMSPSSPAASPADYRTEPSETPETAPGAEHGDATPPNNTICSFICEYCRKLRQML